MSVDNHSTTLERFVPISTAARQLALSQSTLQELIDTGKIRAALLPGGSIGVNESELNKMITREQFKNLRGKSITISQASEKYSIPKITFRHWAQRGYISVLKEGYGMEMDEADVAYCAAVYRANEGSRGKRLFDKSGHQYQPKHTGWATYQRERRRKKKSNV